MTDLIDWILRTGGHNPDLVSILLGTLAANVLGLIVERYWIPETMPARRQQGLTVAISVIAGWVLSFITWGVLDAGDKASLRGVVSASASLVSVIIYPALARWATAKWPAIGSIWAKP